MNDDNEGFEIAGIVPYKIVDTIPSAYRLMKKASGELVLQGVYKWEEGCHYGYDWKDIPTVLEGEQ